jgi:hypothetical protein
MCSYFAKGASLSTVSWTTKVCLNTIRARRIMLLKLGVKMTTIMLRGRGYGTPFYKLTEPLEIAIAKIDAKYLPQTEKKPKQKKTYARVDPNHAGRWEGEGLETWFFMTKDRSDAYKDWCKPWTV